MQFWQGNTPNSGKWTTLTSKVKINGRICIHEFELPGASFKARVLFKNRQKISISELKIYGKGKWRKTACKIEWGCGETGKQIWDGHIEVYNGHFLNVQRLPGKSAKVLSDGSWRCSVSGGKTDGVRVEFLASTEDRTILTLRSAAHSFSFLLDDLENDKVIYLKDFGVLVTSADSRTDWASYSRPPGQTIHARVESMPEQTLSGAMIGVPAKKRTKWLALAASP